MDYKLDKGSFVVIRSQSSYVLNHFLSFSVFWQYSDYGGDDDCGGGCEGGGGGGGGGGVGGMERDLSATMMFLQQVNIDFPSFDNGF